jgi:hypothetical protein
VTADAWALRLVPNEVYTIFWDYAKPGIVAQRPSLPSIFCLSKKFVKLGMILELFWMILATLRIATNSDLRN